MSFTLFVDSGSNLPARKLREYEIQVISFPLEIDGVSTESPKYPDGFDGHSYYTGLKSGMTVKTSLINTDAFCGAFRPELEAGRDVMYVGIASGITGTVQSARIAADLLKEEFPDRSVRIVDSKGAGLGTGILALRAADYRAEGLDVNQTAAKLDYDVENLCEYFTVDDLQFLRRTGRLSGAVAAIGTMLQIKPMLRGDEDGHIVVCGKIRGRKKAIDELAAVYAKRVVDAARQRVAISHGDCLAEAQALARRIREIANPRELILSMHEPLTGAHVGPGMLAVFFFGIGR